MSTDDCNCDERFMVTTEGSKPKRVRLPVPAMIAYHDCDYVRARNKLIPLAEGQAAYATGYRGSGDPSYGNRWTKAFADAMEELWRQNRST